MTTAKTKPTKQAKTIDRAAVYSTRNLHWHGVGELKTGYNIVTIESAQLWLEKHSQVVREATPEEIARELNR
jgi:hypothetical protein